MYVQRRKILRYSYRSRDPRDVCPTEDAATVGRYVGNEIIHRIISSAIILCRYSNAIPDLVDGEPETREGRCGGGSDGKYV
jgi:hypothetical protein